MVPETHLKSYTLKLYNNNKTNIFGEGLMRSTPTISPTFWFQNFTLSAFNNVVRQKFVEWLLVNPSNENNQCQDHKILNVSL